MRQIRNEKGFSLPELIASLPLVALVFIVIAIAVISFITTYEETRLYAQLQQELFETIETIRHGYAMAGVTDEEGLIGLLTARQVDIGYANNSIKIIPIVPGEALGDDNYWVRYHVDNDGRLILNAQYGLQYINNRVIFPQSDEKIGNQYKFRITNRNDVFVDKTPLGSDETFLVGIRLQGEVRFRERGRNQSLEEDRLQNTKTIEYNTQVFLGNKDI
jgi:hypothetical protein